MTLIQSVYQLFGSGILDPDTGVVLHNRGSAFSTDPTHPGRVGPGLRPPHTLLPVIAETDELVLGLGCQGGSAQPWILAQLVRDLLDPAADPADTLGRPRFVIGARDIGYEAMTLLAEPGLPEAAAAADALGLPVVAEPTVSSTRPGTCRSFACTATAASTPRATPAPTDAPSSSTPPEPAPIPAPEGSTMNSTAHVLDPLSSAEIASFVAAVRDERSHRRASALLGHLPRRGEGARR